MSSQLKKDLRASLMALPELSGVSVSVGHRRASAMPQVILSQAADLQPVYLNQHIGLRTISFSISTFTDSYAQGDEIANAIRNHLQAFLGLMNSSTKIHNSVVTSQLEITDDEDDYFHFILSVDITIN
jgi:hypothetical protein